MIIQTEIKSETTRRTYFTITVKQPTENVALEEKASKLLESKTEIALKDADTVASQQEQENSSDQSSLRSIFNITTKEIAVPKTEIQADWKQRKQRMLRSKRRKLDTIKPAETALKREEPAKEIISSVNELILDRIKSHNILSIDLRKDSDIYFDFSCNLSSLFEYCQDIGKCIPDCSSVLPKDSLYLLFKELHS